MIYRIAEPADWASAQRKGEFASADLTDEGFIHCSEQHQVTRTARKYYAGKKSLVLLEIDEILLGAALVREDLAGSGVFPHVYEPIPLSAIVRHFDFTVADDGRCNLPAGLGWSSSINDRLVSGN